jgi:cephalosporin hydroxylase
MDVAKTVRDFSYLFYHGPDGRELFKTVSWLGVPAQRNPLDAWIYQEILYATRPEVIVETGVYNGGSTYFLASLCDLMGRGEIVAVDITLERVLPKVWEHPRITLFESSSTAPEVFEKIKERTLGKRTMVILDSDHSEAHVYEELKLYSPLVSPGCYLICEDSNVNGHPAYLEHGPGPYEALERWLAEADGWQVDRHCERLMCTFNPMGYLKRVA